MGISFLQLESTITAVEKQSTTEGPLGKAVCSVRQFPQPHDSPVILLMATRNPASPVELGSLSHYLQLAGGFTYVLFSPLPGEMIQFDSCFERVGSTTNLYKVFHRPQVVFFLDFSHSSGDSTLARARFAHAIVAAQSVGGAHIWCTNVHERTLKGTLRYLLGWVLRRSWY